jgi:hypothetical protein
MQEVGIGLIGMAWNKGSQFFSFGRTEMAWNGGSKLQE